MMIMKIARTAALAACIASSVFAMAAQADDCAPQVRASFTAKVSEGGLLFIPLTINGHTTQVLFCTSCAWSSLGDRFVDRAGIRKRKGHLRFVDPAGNEPAYYVAADEVKLGDVVFKGKGEFLVDDDSDGGALGLNLMDDFDIELDNEKGAITFYRHHACPRPALGWIARAVEVPFHLRDYQPKGVMEMGGTKLETAISTSHTYTSMSLAIARHQLGVVPEAPGMERIGGVQYGAKVYDRYRVTLPVLTISGLRFTNVPATLVDLDGYGLYLGMHELRQLRLYFALGKKRLYAARPNPHP